MTGATAIVRHALTARLDPVRDAVVTAVLHIDHETSSAELVVNDRGRPTVVVATLAQVEVIP